MNLFISTREARSNLHHFPDFPDFVTRILCFNDDTTTTMTSFEQNSKRPTVWRNQCARACACVHVCVWGAPVCLDALGSSIKLRKIVSFVSRFLPSRKLHNIFKKSFKVLQSPTFDTLHIKNFKKRVSRGKKLLNINLAHFGQKSMFSKAQKKGKKKCEASLNICLQTVKMALKSMVMSVLPNSWPIKILQLFMPKIAVFGFFLCLNKWIMVFSMQKYLILIVLWIP